MRIVTTFPRAVIAAVLALFLAAALPMAALAEGVALGADTQPNVQQTQTPSDSRGEEAGSGDGDFEGNDTDAPQRGLANGEGAQDGTASQNAAQGEVPSAVETRTDETEAVSEIVIDQSGDSTLSLSSDGTFTLSGATSGSGAFDGNTKLALEPGIEGTLTINGSGTLAGAQLMDWDQHDWTLFGLSVIIASDSVVEFSGPLDCIDLTVLGTLKSTLTSIGDEYIDHLIGVYGVLMVQGGAIDVQVSGASYLSSMIMIDAGHLADWDTEAEEWILPTSRVDGGGSVTVSADGGETGGTMLRLNFTEFAIKDASVTMASTDGSYASGIVGYAPSRLSLDGGSITMSLSQGLGINVNEAVLGASGSIDIETDLQGMFAETLLIGDEANRSSATIDIVSGDMGIEVARRTEIFGVGKEVPSVTVSAGTPEEWGWKGAIFRGPHIVNTKVSADMVSKESTGMLLSLMMAPVPTYATLEAEEEQPVGIVDNATIVANGTDVGLEIDGERFEFTNSAFDTSASGRPAESEFALLSTPVTYPTAAILSHPGKVFVDATSIKADGATYGWLSACYEQPDPPDPYTVRNSGEDDYDSTRIYASNGSDIAAVGDVAGIALAGSVESSSGSEVVGTSRLVDVYSPDANDVAAIDISNYEVGKNEIKANGGTVTECYSIPVSDALADNANDAFNPYAGSWHMVKPSNYAWSVNHPQVLFAAHDTGVYTTSGTGSAESGLEITATRTANAAGEKVVVGPEGSSHNVVLLAGIKPQDTVTYLVQFEPNGGAPKPADQTVARATAAIEPSGAEKPVLEGHTLEGWYADEALSTKWDFADLVMGDMTLYAKWVADDPVPPGPIDPDPDPVDPKPTDPKPIDTGKALARTGDGPAPIVAAVLAAMAAVVLVSVTARYRMRDNNVTN
ncbi:InlB B-repeat-containing protein [Raoultibacter phocaeensis]|uniref:InlB B-repeat-containing protein n=1 Tax=Raoultibacter phocaeensis TaxID=2479841 RepID=UPI0015D5D51A|nr:InlB B-repeat-containing protein [Raoultibacter phocaeensis]